MRNNVLTFTLPPRHKTYTSGTPDFRFRGGLAAARSATENGKPQ
jgi:hypothetical protein